MSAMSDIIHPSFMKKFRVSDSRKVWKKGSKGRILVMEPYDGRNAWHIGAVFTRFGMKGKARFDYNLMYIPTIDHNQLPQKDREIVDVVYEYEGLAPLTNRRNIIPDTYIEYEDPPSMNVLDWDVDEMIAYTGTISMFFELLDYLRERVVKNGNLLLTQMPVRAKIVPNDMTIDMLVNNHVNLDDYHYMTREAIDRKNIHDILVTYFSSANNRKNFMDQVNKRMASAKLAINKYFERLYTHESNIESRFDEVLKYYKKHREDLKEIEKIREKNGSYWHMRKKQAEREEKKKPHSKKKDEHVTWLYKDVSTSTTTGYYD